MKNSDASSAKKRNSKKFVFLCETPLHLFNAINFVSNDLEGSGSNSDIFIHHSFKNSRQASENLKTLGLFSSVFDIDLYNEKVDLLTKFRILYRLFFPRSALKGHIAQDVNLNEFSYDNLVLFSYTMRCRNLLGTFKDAHHIMIEDGIGAYHLNQITYYVDGYYALLDKYIFRGKYAFNPEKLYVYHPSICVSGITENILKLPEIKKDGIAYENAIKTYGYVDNDLYLNKKLVYFTQPLEQLPVKYRADSEYELNNTITKLELKEKLIVRIHPRQEDVELFDTDSDDVNNFWELECVNSITDKHVLISAFSTAAFTPKYINDIEPYVIFTYRLQYDEIHGLFWDNMEKLIDKFSMIYKDKGKIFIPKDYDEFKKILKDIC